MGSCWLCWRSVATATPMSRGILFQQEMDWRLGAVPVALASAGLGFKYVKEAVTWSED